LIHYADIPGNPYFSLVPLERSQRRGIAPIPKGGDFSPTRLSLGMDGAIFVLDRAHAQVYRFSPEDGSQIWRIDGTEGGEAFVDPVYLSRGDGFYLYLTDRGSRKVWRIDYRGEIRGSLDLPFAMDPMFFELAAGRQMVLYDRTTALVHLLDDSGRSLFSFTPGGGGKAAEPVDFAVTLDGRSLFILWPGNGGVSSSDLFGRKSFDPLEIPAWTVNRCVCRCSGTRYRS